MLNRHRWAAGLVAVVAIAAPVAGQAGDPGALYGRLTTLRGEVYEGFIRWDRNEGHWADIIDASKEVPLQYLREAERLGGARAPNRRRVDVLGLRFTVDRGGPSRQSGVRLGHVARLTVLDDDYALLTLKSGESVELRGSPTDLGSGNQGIYVYSETTEARFDWDRIDFIEFGPAPPGVISPLGTRLYGTLEAESGASFSGWITWDMDEIFTTDELDGDSGGRRHEIAFGDIASITVSSGAAAEVTLRSGETMTLRGTNDVNSGNRGIMVGDPALGQVRMDWRQLRRITFRPAPAEALAAFGVDRRLAGTVTTADGESYSGALRWDNDEAWTWEILDGDADGMEFKIEFGLVARVDRVSETAAAVTLRDGRTVELSGSNDVGGEGHNGIIVEHDDGRRTLVRWPDVTTVTFR